MKALPVVKFNDGRQMPQLGLGVWQISNQQVVSAIDAALAIGYRSIDTAAAYDNEEGVGEAIRRASVPRENLFITTKLWNSNHGYDKALKAIEQSLQRLKMDYVDLYLIHWPVPKASAYVETWRALIKMRELGHAKSIGVSNFTIQQLQRLLAETGVVPAVNQIELHPLLQQKALREFHAQHAIVTESWSPLAQGQVLDHPVLVPLARRHGKTPAQIVLRWHLQNGLVAIPKSVTPSRIRQNLDILDFTLEPTELERIAALDCNHRIGPDPDTFALDG